MESPITIAPDSDKNPCRHRSGVRLNIGAGLAQCIVCNRHPPIFDVLIWYQEICDAFVAQDGDLRQSIAKMEQEVADREKELVDLARRIKNAKGRAEYHEKKASEMEGEGGNA